jgi:hypothetical protein
MELSGRQNARIVPLLAEKRDMLTESPTTDTPQSISRSKAHALRLLNPWISGDRRTLEFELNRWREGTFGLNSERVDAESNDGREELLFCLVQQMVDEPDLFAPRDEKMHLGVWVDLLSHLAHPELEESGSFA